MSHDNARVKAGTRRAIAMLAAALLIAMIKQASAGDIILFTASTDNSGGLNPISVPNNNNPFIPAIDPAVTLAPNPALLDGNAVGPLNGITYGPTDGAGDTAGTTGFVTSSYTLPTSGYFRLVFEVAKTTGAGGESALATDNITLGGNPVFNFQPNGLGFLPVGLDGEGTFGTIAKVSGLAPSAGAAFAWIDTTGGLVPIYDTVSGVSASRLYSVPILGTAGMTLNIDAAFLTSDGGAFSDYGIIALQSVPEPSSLVLFAAGSIGVAGIAVAKRTRRS
jgi:hypothetical protein